MNDSPSDTDTINMPALVGEGADMKRVFTTTRQRGEETGLNQMEVRFEAGARVLGIGDPYSPQSNPFLERSAGTSFFAGAGSDAQQR
ncbi:hypothetical protein OAO87_02760 [bacterium]|nr:hypothetical protein [bacterium]